MLHRQKPDTRHYGDPMATLSQPEPFHIRLQLIVNITFFLFVVCGFGDEEAITNQPPSIPRQACQDRGCVGRPRPRRRHRHRRRYVRRDESVPGEGVTDHTSAGGGGPAGPLHGFRDATRAARRPGYAPAHNDNDHI
jgi:hypothetical protein